MFNELISSKSMAVSNVFELQSNLVKQHKTEGIGWTFLLANTTDIMTHLKTSLSFTIKMVTRERFTTS